MPYVRGATAPPDSGVPSLVTPSYGRGADSSPTPQEHPMANTIPVDSTRIVLIALSGARPMPARVELSDGTTRIDPNGAQATHKITGARLWQIDAAMAADPADERGRAVNMTVKVATNERPMVQPGL